VRRTLLVAAVVMLLAAPPVAVAGGCPQTTVADLEDEVMCPLCGTSLGLARESPQAKRERVFIARQIASCRSKDEIKAALVTEFGPAVLAEPRHSGFAASAYAVPIIGGFGALAVVLLALLRWRRRAGRAPGEALADDDNRRLELELDRWR
jgi:cytochrome c-type biogenesis protein CcmH